MARLMAVSLTEQAVRERRKTVTRRLGWWVDKHGRRILIPGAHLTLCRKVQGRCRPDGTIEPLVCLADVVVTSVRREMLDSIIAHPEDVAREGFEDWCAGDFIEMFCREMRIGLDTEVTRIEWRYLGEEAAR